MTQLIQDYNPAKYLIQSFEPGKVRINDQWYHDAIALNANHLHCLAVNTLEQLDMDSLSQVLAWRPDILLLGTGSTLIIPAQKLLGSLMARQIGVEFMDSGAACRTFHVLSAEQRNVAAVILT